VKTGNLGAMSVMVGGPVSPPSNVRRVVVSVNFWRGERRTVRTSKSEIPHYWKKGTKEFFRVHLKVGGKRSNLNESSQLEIEPISDY